MKKQEKNLIKTTDRKPRSDQLKPICWMVIPIITAALLVLDGLGVYTFNMQRLLVLGIELLVILLPFFREITIKGISIKCKPEPNTNDERQTADQNTT